MNNSYESKSVHRVLFKCPLCKRVERHEYAVHHVATDNEHPTYYLRKTYHEYTISENGAVLRTITARLLYPDIFCQCRPPQYKHDQGRAMRSTRINGVTTDRKCDHRCTSAKGADCECSCGGVNHGVDHQVAITDTRLF